MLYIVVVARAVIARVIGTDAFAAFVVILAVVLFMLV